MIQVECDTVRTAIPDLAHGRLESGDIRSVEDHLAGCAECRAELDLARLLVASRPEIPTDLSVRVVASWRAERTSFRRPWWALTAAAVAALALGIGITSDSSAPVLGEAPGFASEYDDGQLWMSDDGLLAGAPAIDDLSDEALLELLDELATERGAA